MLMRDFETCLESTDDTLGIWNLEEVLIIELAREPMDVPQPQPRVPPGVL